MKLRDAILAESLPLPPIGDLAYQYVVAGNGLFIRAEDSRMEAMVPAALAYVHGLEPVDTFARLKVPRVPAKFLWAIHQSARRHLPNEAMFQLSWEEVNYVPSWRCFMPYNTANPVKLDFDDRAGAVIDLHSHGTASAFFSDTDDGDEQGLRFYVVVGHVDRSVVDVEPPQIAVRVGVYGHHWNVPLATVFDGDGPFVQVDPEVELVLAEAEDDRSITDH